MCVCVGPEHGAKVSASDPKNSFVDVDFLILQHLRIGKKKTTTIYI